MKFVVIKKIKSFIFIIMINTLIFFVILEILSFFLTKYKYLPIKDIPSYNLKVFESDYSGLAWRNEKFEWGAWHKSLFKTRHLKECFEVDYISNDIGARDIKNYLPLKNNINNIVILGDSFGEGFGLDIKQTFSFKLENKKNRNVLNFSSGGDFGPLSQYILYQNLVQNYKHSELLYLFLPANDFYDNSYKFISNFGDRFRPYFKKNNSNKFEIYYPKNAIKRDNFDNTSLKSKKTIIKIFLKEFTYTSNIIRSINHLIKHQNTKMKTGVADNLSKSSGYFATDRESIEGSIYFLDKLFSIMDKKVKKTLIIIPSQFDLKNILEKGYIYKDFLWYKKLIKIGNMYNVSIIDLARKKNKDLISKELKDGINDWFLSCDGHWNSSGNIMALNRYLEN